MSQVVDRFIRYIQTDTQSDPKSGLHPSSPSQLAFAQKLADELKTIGLHDVHVDERAYVMATLPGNINRNVPIVGFVSHVDTSPDFTAKDVKPQFVENYDGKDIILNAEQGIVMKTAVFPELLMYKGQTLITTNGTTLLGADDKAGVAEIVTAMEYLLAHPKIEHGEIKVGFTPDEEIGEGADFFDVQKFGANFAYTMDGDEIGVIEYENFNAASAKIVINGRIVHPGYAKNKMKNSLLVAQRLLAMLPASEVPEKTEGFEGFFHLMNMKGEVERCEMEFIIRDHSFKLFEKRKAMMQGVVNQLNLEYGEGTVELDMKDQYFNMLKQIEPVQYIVDLAEQAMRDCGIEPKIKAIRGGTDGARLSYMGLPCPNIFAGGHNFHGKFEFVPVQSMEKAVDVIVRIAEKTAQL